MNQNETGRSMVEMLGVLAIMGVLTVGGVAGYRYAVDKMDANEIVDELIKRAVTASQQRVLGRTINLSEYGNNGAIAGVYGVTPTDRYNGNGFQFALSVQDVPQRVCDMILNSDWTLPREIIVGGIVVTEDTSCAEGNNDMTFAFSNTLGSGDVGNGETSDVTTAVTTEVTATETMSPEISESISNPEVSVSLEVSDDKMSCESLKGFGRDGGESRVCASCGDIRTLDKNGSCWLTTCPDGYMHDFASFGTCIPCSQMDNATNSDFEDGGTMTQMFISECQACGGTYHIGDLGLRSGICSSNSVAMSTVTEVTTQTVTETVSPEISESISEPEESVSGGGQICGTNGNCYDCSYDGYYADYVGINVDNTSECSICDGSGYTWTPVYRGNQRENASIICIRCDLAGIFSDFEDNVEASCRKCGLGVNWARPGIPSGVYSCAPTAEDIGTKPEAYL